MNLTPHEAIAVVEGYLDTMVARDIAGARRYLVDKGFEYVSPIAYCQNADEFVENMGAPRRSSTTSRLSTASPRTPSSVTFSM